MLEDTKKIIKMIDILSPKDKERTYKFIKNIILNWDSDFEKLTSYEKKRLLKANKELENNEIYNHNEINWD